MEQWVSETIAQYAYSPYTVYGAIITFMLMSAFGIPIPEEVILISAGLVGYMALNPDQFPPPYAGAHSVNVYVLAAVAFVAVMGSDFLIYYIGKRLGPRLFKLAWFKRLVSDAALEKIQRWMWNYGYWAVIIFRFTPGVRFPGHLTCGAMGLSPWKFIAVDWLAAGLSVPTQVLLVSFYGKYILKYFKEFKIVLFSILGTLFIAFLISKWLQGRRQKLQPAALSAPVATTTDPTAVPPTEPPRGDSAP